MTSTLRIMYGTTHPHSHAFITSIFDKLHPLYAILTVCILKWIILMGKLKKKYLPKEENKFLLVPVLSRFFYQF